MEFSFNLIFIIKVLAIITKNAYWKQSADATPQIGVCIHTVFIMEPFSAD